MISVWNDSTDLPGFPVLKGDMRTEVLIIGGGITGILTAYLLHQRGIPYILVEKNRICGGTTRNTTAKITYQHGLIYDKILKGSGPDEARNYLQANQWAFDEYEKLCREIPCDYERKHNYVYSVNHPEKLEAELKALDKIGYSARFCKDIPLPFETAGAVCFPDQAQFHPLKFLNRIAQGLNIYEHTAVWEMIGSNTAVTNRGRIHADKVITATHFPFINNHGSYFLKLYQHRSYVVALENAQDVHGMYLDECRTGLSFRNYGDLLLMGGGSHRTGKQGGSWNELRSLALKYYPQAKERYYWAAQDCMSLDDIPYIGQYSGSTPNLYVASGFHKWGMTGSMLAALLLRDMVQDIQNDYAECFSPSRSMIKPQLLVNGFEAAKNLLTITGKRCPHLGCALKWNSAEHTWDCACHGSRFTENGTVLDNPANGDLQV